MLIPFRPRRDRLVVSLVQMESSRVAELLFVQIARLDTNATMEVRLLVVGVGTAMDWTAAKIVYQAINALANPTGSNAIVGRTKTRPAPQIVSVAKTANINKTQLNLCVKHAQLGIFALLYLHSLVVAKFCFVPPVLPRLLLSALEIIPVRILKKWHP